MSTRVLLSEVNVAVDTGYHASDVLHKLLEQIAEEHTCRSVSSGESWGGCHQCAVCLAKHYRTEREL